MQRPRGGKVALVFRHVPQVAEHASDTLPIAQFPRDRQALLIESPSRRKIALIVGHVAQVVQRVCDALPVPQFPNNRQALLVQQPGSRKVSLIAGHKPQVVQRTCYAPPVAQLTLDRQALLIERPGGGIVALLIGQHARRLERPRALPRSLLSSGLCQDAHAPFAALRKISPSPPEPLQRSTKPKTAFRSRLREAPVQRRAQVVVLFVQTTQPLCLLRAHRFRFRLLRQRQEVVPIPFPHAFLVACGN